jgi:hypothetical protein
MKKASCTILLLMTIASAQASEAVQKRYYDAKGNSLGTSSRDSQGTTTFRDARGRVIGKGSK